MNNNPGHLGRDFARLWWVGAIVLIAAALAVGFAASRNTASTAVRAAPAASVIATAVPPTTVVSTPLPAAAAAPAATGPAAEAAQPTPTDAEKAAWYTQQVSSEQDYCSCNQTSSSLSVVNPPKPNPTNP
ncbi:MAG TPA: hypothetical protein VIO35_06315 [Chloroflexota bacterium]|jgi:hypothetical protein